MGHALLEAARRIAPELSERALEAEQLCTMPPDLVEKVRDAGLFHIAMPAELGGPECEPELVFEIVEEVCRADGSAGWTIMINNSTCFAAWLEPAVAKQLVADHPNFIAASMFGPTATATAEADELVVSGRWPFNSGSPHADFLINGFFVMDDGSPRMRPDGTPDWRFGYIPRQVAEVVDTWHVSGLRGTGSHDTAVQGVRIPAELTIAPLLEPAKLGGPMFRLPFTTLLVTLMSGFPIGVARRAIDELVALAQTKSRTFGPGKKMVEDEIIQYEVARAEGALRAARAQVLEVVGRAMDVVRAGDTVEIRLRAEATLATLQAGRTARDIVDTMCNLAGGGAIYESSPLQRCARDIAAGSAHAFFAYNRWKEVGRVLLGQEPTTFFI